MSSTRRNPKLSFINKMNVKTQDARISKRKIFILPWESLHLHTYLQPANCPDARLPHPCPSVITFWILQNLREPLVDASIRSGLGNMLPLSSAQNVLRRSPVHTTCAPIVVLMKTRDILVRTRDLLSVPCAARPSLVSTILSAMRGCTPVRRNFIRYKNRM